MEVKKTITSIFIVPTLNIDKGQLKDNGFINGYIYDDRRDVQYENAVYLLFKPKDLDKFRKFIEDQTVLKKGIIDDYDYEDGYVVVVYNLNKKFKKDFELIKEGLYSMTSKSFQNLFPKTVTIEKQKGKFRDETALQHRVFSKSDDLRSYWEEKIDIKFTEDMEVWEGFDFRKETLDLEKFKQEEIVL